MKKTLYWPRLVLSAAISAMAMCGLANVAFAQGVKGVADSGQAGGKEAIAPFMADEVSENTRLLLDGNQITHKSITYVFRDSKGRTRREEHQVNSQGVPDDVPVSIYIDDPVAGAFYSLDPRRHYARKVARQDAIDFASSGPLRSVPRQPDIYRADNGREYRREPLGSQEIEGFNTEGIRITEVIPAGAQGNEKPLEIVTEIWFSTDLPIALLRKHDDPFSGQTITRATNIRLEEPSPDVFQVPSDYTVEVVPPSAPPPPSKPAENK
jgi:uncharacterized protein YdeI (BOF family)